MRIEIKAIGPEVAIVRPSGRLTAGLPANLFSRTVEQLLSLQYLHLVVNLSGIELMDCAGAGQLVWCLLCALRAGGSMRLAGLSPRISQLLSVLRLNEVLEVHQTEEIAVAPLAPLMNHPRASTAPPSCRNQSSPIDYLVEVKP